MEPTDGSGMYYVRENGRLHVLVENNSIPSGFKYIKHQYDPSSSATISNNVLHSHDSVLTLFDLCVVYVSTNVQNIDSLAGFPEIIGEKIFAAVRNRRILQMFADHDCALVLQVFDDAYGSLLLEELNVKSLAVLEQHVDSFSAFRHITKLDLTGCTLGDNHDYLLHISHLSL